MVKKISLIFLGFVLICIPPIYAKANFLAGNFSAGEEVDGLPPDWEPLTFLRTKNHSLYEFFRDQNTYVIRATSQDAASGLKRTLKLDPKEYQLLRWSWKATKLIEGADVSIRSKDDAPVRMMVAFDVKAGQLNVLNMVVSKSSELITGFRLTTRVVNYVWDNQHPVGTILESKVSPVVRYVVVEQGDKNLNQWVSYERNIYEDFKKAFKTEPDSIVAVGIMTDTDAKETPGASAVSFFGDIEFSQAEPETEP